MYNSICVCLRDTMAGMFLAHYNVLIHTCITNYVQMKNANVYASINISAIKSLVLYAQKQRKPWFDEECSKCLNQRMQATMQQLQDPNHSNVHNMCDVRSEASRHFRKKRRKCLEDKINELETNTMNKNTRVCTGASMNSRRFTSLES